jgi:hypothetical protein
MSDSESVLRKAFQFIDKEADSSDGSCIVIMGVEINAEGLPTGRAVKVMGSPAATLAALTLMEQSITETRKEVLTKLDEATERPQMAEEMIKKLETLDKLGMLDAFVNSLEDNEESDRIKKLISELKKRFGK